MTFKAQLLWLVVGCLSAGETGCTILHARQADGVPRNRLLTDTELLAQFTGAQSVGARACDFLRKGDTVSARKTLSEYFGSRTSPRFFFEKNEVKARSREYARLFPGDIRDAKKRTDDFIKTYGADVDWMIPGRDLRGRPHTPNTIRGLARQREAFNLAVRFFQENENPQILRFLMTHVRDFAADFEAGKVETGDNDVFERFYGGHRMRTWIMMHQLLLASPLYSADDQVLMLKLILLHGAKLADQSKSFNWGNHQLVGLVALYELSVMFPEFKAAAGWHAQSRKLILEHLEKEIAPDGFQAERSSHYHKLDVINYFLVLQLARLNGETLPPVFQERFKKMFQAMAAVAMPNKHMPILQDVADYLDIDSDRSDEEMSLGSLLFADRTLRYFARNELPASFYWYLDRNAVSRYQSINPSVPAFKSLALPQTGYYVMRTGWDSQARYLLIDGGLAADKPDHSHGGVLGVIGYAIGGVVLPNYPVRYSDKSFKDMKNSLAKSVALVDDVLQGRGWTENLARTGFGRWATLPKPTVNYWVSGSVIDYFDATHDGFQSAGVNYSRSIVFLKPDAWLVIDNFTSSSSHRYQQIWQGDYKIETGEERAVRESQKGLVELIPVGARIPEIREHQAASASGVRFEEKTDGAAEMATLIHVGASPRGDRAQAAFDRSESSSRYSVEIGTSRWVIERFDKHGLGQNVERGSLSVSRLEAKVLKALVVVDGSRLQAGDFDLVLNNPASSQIVKDKANNWEFKLLSGEVNTVKVSFKNRPARTYDIKPGQPLVLTPR